MPQVHPQESPTLSIRSSILFIKGAALSAMLIGPLYASPDIAYDTLEGLIQKGATAFSIGDYATSSNSFQSAHEIYGEEPEWKDARLSEKILPLSGFASLKAGLFERSVSTLSDFLEEENYAYSQEIFVRYALALAYQNSGDIDSAISECRALQNTAHSTSLKSLATFREAQLLLESDRENEGMDLLVQISQSEGARRVKQQARLLAIRETLGNDELEKSFSFLRSGNWNEESMPELALLSISALEIGDKLLEAESPNEALWCYQQVLPLEELVRLQRAKLHELKTRFKQRQAELGIAATIWQDFYKQILASLEQQLVALQNTPDYEPHRQLRKGKCFLLAGRPREAWLIFERLVRESTDFDSKARYLWMLAARDAGYLPQAVAIGTELVELYPDSPDTIDALRLIGLALQEQEMFREAIDVFVKLTEQAPTHLEKDDAMFQVAYCYSMLREYPIAVELFSELRANAEHANLREQAHLWIGLIRFFQSRFDDALNEFTALSRSARSPHIQIESQYRSATCLFALSKYDDSAELCETLLEKVQNERTAEIRLLAADSRKAIGEFEEALRHYLSIPEELIELRHHASIGAAEIYLNLNHPEKADTLLTRTRDSLLNPESICENAIYLADVRLAQNLNERAQAALHYPLLKFGNLKEVEGTLPLIELLHSLSSDWISEKQKLLDKAEHRDSSILSARLTLEDALSKRSKGNETEAESQLIALANEFEPANLPSECLAYASAALVEIGSPYSEELASRLMEYYPNSRYISFGYYVLGKRASENEEHAQAIAWLSQMGQDADEFPIHLPSRMLEAKSRIANKEYDAATVIYESILQNRSYSSKTKAEALFGIAELNLKQDKAKSAIAHYQRLYTLYAAFPEYASKAYYQSALAFDRIGLPQEALKTIDELVSIDRYKEEASIPKSVLLKSEILLRHPELNATEPKDEGGES